MAFAPGVPMDCPFVVYTRHEGLLSCIFKDSSNFEQYIEEKVTGNAL